MEILRISTAGSVDDGKSTLIGRLLWDTHSLPKDKVENIKALSEQKGLSEVDLSLITDGLSAEREQGITIDVAHIYFASKERKYIIADSPGHVEYTRNMITGASNADVFVILIDARKGIIEQTKRHLFIAGLIGIKDIIFVVNKIDLVDFEEKRYLDILSDLQVLIKEFNLIDRSLTYIPISAKHGDNVVSNSSNTPWYTGDSLLNCFESIDKKNSNDKSLRFEVQYVIRPHSDEFHDFRGYAGKIKSGKVKLGDTLKVASTGQKSKIKKLLKYKEELLEAYTGDSVVIELEDDIDISRGDILLTNELAGRKELSSTICWLNRENLNVNSKYILQRGSSRTMAKINRVDAVLDFEDLKFSNENNTVGVNAIAKTNIKTAAPVFIDDYNHIQENGYFILIDEGTNNTVAIGFTE